MAAFESSFDTSWLQALADDLTTNNFAIRDDISHLSGVDPLKCRVEAESFRPLLKTATISTGMSSSKELSKRSDKVTFLKMDHDLATNSPEINRHVAWVDSLRIALENLLNLKMEKSTLMLAEYPSEGSRYVKHRDAAPSEYAGRKLTCIYYLNPEWRLGHGGELHIWPNEVDDTDVVAPQIVAPHLDRLLIFRSYLEHEVQPAYFHRIALTAWFVNRRHMALELMCEQLSLQEDRRRDKTEHATKIDSKIDE